MQCWSGVKPGHRWPPAEDPADEELVARIAGGDREAFAAFTADGDRLYRFALLVCGSAPVADDVTQDVFVEVIHHAGRFQPIGPGGAWLFGVARNHVRRSLDRRPTESLPDDDTENATLAIDADPLAGLARRQYLMALRRAVLALPVKDPAKRLSCATCRN